MTCLQSRERLVVSDFTDEKGNFSAGKFVQSVCENTEIAFSKDRYFDFKEGWKQVFKYFIQQVSDCHFYIQYANDHLDFLDIRVHFSDAEDASQVYLAAMEARNLSMETCAQCGGEKNQSQRGKLCKKCIKGGPGAKLTGTWLDEY